MRRHPGFWTLPAARTFIRKLRPVEGGRRSVFVHEPHDPAELVRAIETDVRDEGLDEVCAIPTTGSDARLVEHLAHAFGGRADTPEGFALDLDYAVILAHGVEGDAPLRHDLRCFARAAAARVGSAAPVVVMISRVIEPACEPPVWASYNTFGILGPLDGASFAAGVCERGNGIASRLSVAVAVEVGAWDLDIVERLLSMPLATAIRPDLEVQRWSDERFDTWRDVEKAEWQAGTYDGWGGDNYVHPLFLAVHRPDLLAKRVWRGQVATLFPWLEERRQEIVRAHQHRLRPESSAMHDDADSLDWGPLFRQIQGAPRRFVTYVQSARALRNRLAHGRPATWQEIRTCLALAEDHGPERSRA